MKFEIYNGDFVGTAEWRGPGHVALEMDDPANRAWFEHFFAAEDSTLIGPVECAEMSSAERRDASQEAFERALYQLAAYSYKVRRDDEARHPAYAQSPAG
ncbi:MAG: hypothetical protein ACRDKZ_10610 [Actinomycetota bacterium]